MNEKQLGIFLEKLYQYSLKLCFENITHAPLELSLEESSKYIVEWLNNPDNTENVSYLDLNSKNLFCLPREIKKLTQLTCLHLDHNQLRLIPHEIGHLKNLISLSLDHNQLKSIPYYEIGHLEYLRMFSFHDNQID